MNPSPRNKADPSSGRTPPSRPTPWRVWPIIAVLLLAFATQNVLEMRRESCTFDELAKFTAGFTYVLKGDFRLNPYHPPLLKILSALPPLLLLHPKIDFNNPGWQIPPDQWKFGSDFLYSNNADQVLFYGRMPVVLLTTLLGYFIFRWAQQLYGNRAGVMALGLFAFSPTFIAHSHLVTLDAGTAAFTTMSLYFLWRHVERDDRRAIYWSAVLMAAALASKFTALPMLPAAGILLWIFKRSKPAPGNPADSLLPSTSDKHAKAKLGKKKTKPSAPRASDENGLFRSLFRVDRSRLIALLIFLGITIIFIQGTYLGRSNITQYFSGMNVVQKNIPHDQGLNFLHGELKNGTWWYYFLVAFAVKETAAFLILIGIRFVLLLWNWREGWRNATFLLLPAVIYFVAVSLRAPPLGVRYLLPAIPLLMVFCGGLVQILFRKRFLLWAAWLLLGWHAASSLLAFPHHLSYFNEFVGGPAHGMDWLDDSNIDWDQELKSLKKVLDQQGIRTVTIFTMTYSDRPDYYGIHFHRLNRVQAYEVLSSPNPPPGVYVFSAHWLARLKPLGINWRDRYPVIANLGYSMFVFRVL